MTSTARIVERPYRALLKTLSWRITGTIDTMVISYFITGSINKAFAIGTIEVFTKMALYYFHERIWSRLDIGRALHHPPDA